MSDTDQKEQSKALVVEIVRDQKPVRAGQPTKYKEQYCHELIEHMQKGFSFESFAGRLLVSGSTLYNWVDLFPEFSEAKHVGEYASRLFWEGVLVDNIVTRRESYFDENGNLISSQTQLNAPAYALAMRNLHKWRMKDPDETPSDGAKKPLTLAYSPEDIKKAKEAK